MYILQDIFVIKEITGYIFFPATYKNEKNYTLISAESAILILFIQRSILLGLLCVYCYMLINIPDNVLKE